MNRRTYTIKFVKDHEHRTYLHVLFESPCLTKLLNMETVRNSEVMLVQTVDHCVHNSAIFVLCHIFVNY
jgi:hypothetical protein